MKFKFIRDLTSDVVFEAYGGTKAELFENAGLALMNVISQAGRIKPVKEIRLEASGEDLKDLLFNWLQKIIETVDVDGIFISKFRVTKISDTGLTATGYGEDADPSKGGTVVKSVTYYKFGIDKTKSGYKATVSLDI